MNVAVEKNGRTLDSTHHRLPVEVQRCVQGAVRQLAHLLDEALYP